MRTHVGPHPVQVFLGSGGDAEVWAGVEALTGARVAIKRNKSDRSQGRAGRLIREYQYLRMLTLDGVPRARALGVDEEGQLFLVMDLVEGVSAGTWAERALTEGREVARVVRMLGEAGRLLGEVHAQGLLHGDVKPACFLVGDGDEVALIDFGGARPILTDHLTRPIEEAFGTAVYSAPEILRRQPPTHATEVYGLAATAFRMLTGELPLGRGTRAELRERLQNTDPASLRPRLDAACPELDPDLAAILVAGLAIAPEDRPTLGDWCRACGVEPGPRARRPARPAERARAPEIALSEYSPGHAALLAALAVAAEPVSPRALADALGVSPREVTEALHALSPAVARVDTLTWRLTATPRGAPAALAKVAGPLADALADEPIGAARVLALSAAGRHAELIEALERWVAALAATGHLAEAVPVIPTLPRMREAGREGRFLLARAKVELAAPSFDVALDHQLAQASARDPVLGASLAKARWALARHFGALHVASSPAALGMGWRALVMGEVDAVEGAVEAALEEARWLRLADVEADALLLASHLRAARGEMRWAARLAAEAVDRWPARGPGLGEAVATLARHRTRVGAFSEARRLLGRAEAPTPVDRAHLLLALAELELELEHDAVVEDALAAVEGLVGEAPPPGLEARLMALRLAVPRGAPALEEAHDRLRAWARDGLALRVSELAPALAWVAAREGAWTLAEAAVTLAHEAARTLDDPGLQLEAWAGSALLDQARGPSPELVARAAEIGLWPALVRFGRARGELDLALRAARHMAPLLDQADANALMLMPWAVAAEARG